MGDQLDELFQAFLMMVIVVVMKDYGSENSHDGDKSNYSGNINTLAIVLRVTNILLGRSAIRKTTMLSTNYHF